jgi:hypothetical protein
MLTHLESSCLELAIWSWCCQAGCLISGILHMWDHWVTLWGPINPINLETIYEGSQLGIESWKSEAVSGELSLMYVYWRLTLLNLSGAPREQQERQRKRKRRRWVRPWEVSWRKVCGQKKLVRCACLFILTPHLCWVSSLRIVLGKHGYIYNIYNYQKFPFLSTTTLHCSEISHPGCKGGHRHVFFNFVEVDNELRPLVTTALHHFFFWNLCPVPHCVFKQMWVHLAESMGFWESVLCCIVRSSRCECTWQIWFSGLLPASEITR